MGEASPREHLASEARKADVLPDVPFSEHRETDGFHSEWVVILGGFPISNWNTLNFSNSV
jgi:hypothetical protein